MTGQTLILDIWRLVFEHVERENLYDVCQTCKSFNAIATPILYRTISLIAPEPDRMGHLPWHKRVEEPVFTLKNSPLKRYWHLLSRLEDELNDALRDYVQELDLYTETCARTAARMVESNERTKHTHLFCRISPF